MVVFLSGCVWWAYEAMGVALTSAAYWCSNALAGPLRQLSARTAESGSGKMSSSPFSTPSKMARATDCGGGLGDLEASGHVGVGGAGQDGVHPDAPRGQQGRAATGSC